MTLANEIRRTTLPLLALICLGATVAAPSVRASGLEVAQLVPVEPYWPGMIQLAPNGAPMPLSRPGLPSTSLPRAAPQAAPSGPLSAVSGWTGGPVKTRDGAFSYCVIEAEYETGHALIIARNAKGEINVAVGMPEAQLPVDSGWTVKLKVDDLIERERNAMTPEPQMLVIPNGADTELYNALMRGRALEIRSNADKISFNLKATRRALNELRNCADKGLTHPPISVS